MESHPRLDLSRMGVRICLVGGILVGVAVLGGVLASADYRIEIFRGLLLGPFIVLVLPESPGIDWWFWTTVTVVMVGAWIVRPSRFSLAATILGLMFWFLVAVGVLGTVVYGI